MKLTLAAGITVGLAALCMPSLAAAQQVQFVIGDASRADGDSWTIIDILILNSSADDQQVALPAQVAATITSDTALSIPLERVSGEQATVSVSARGFARTRYRARIPVNTVQPTTLIGVPAWHTSNVALPAPPAGAREEHAHSEPQASPAEASAMDQEAAGESHLLRHVSSHEATYAAFGTSAGSEVLLQASFKYRLLGSSHTALPLHRWQDGIYFAYTQQLFVNLAADSSIETNYTPELFYRTPAIAAAESMHAGIDLGIQHESNGRAGPESRSVNTVYVSPTVMWDLGNDYDLQISPRVGMLVGGRADNPDIKSYRGNTGLKLQIGQSNGFRLSTVGRLNVSNGRGAVTAETSYPFSRILDGMSGFYLFGRFFTGYGETLLGYNQRTTRVRFGLGISR